MLRMRPDTYTRSNSNFWANLSNVSLQIHLATAAGLGKLAEPRFWEFTSEADQHRLVDVSTTFDGWIGKLGQLLIMLFNKA